MKDRTFVRVGDSVTIGDVTWRVSTPKIDPSLDPNVSWVWVIVAQIENHLYVKQRYPKLANVHWERHGYSPEHARQRLYDLMWDMVQYARSND